MKIDFNNKNTFKSRVSPRLVHNLAKGSKQNRMNLALIFRLEAIAKIEDLFLIKAQKKVTPNITKQELFNILKPLSGGVNFKLKQNDNPRNLASVRQVTKFGVVERLDFRLGFIKKNLQNVFPKDSRIILHHELTHFFDFIFNPKIIARMNLKSKIGKIPGYTPEVHNQHFDFYKAALYRKVDNKKEPRVWFNRLKKDIDEHFDLLNSSSEEKIEVLQSWRHGLELEKNVRYFEMHFLSKTPERLRANLKFIEQKFMYKAKINWVEHLLATEISKVRRQLHAANAK